MSSIFVQISAYHDHELSNTVNAALRNASGKHSINFGIHVLYKDNNDLVLPSGSNIGLVLSEAPRNIGVGIGRYIAHQFYNNEDYYLQIDSHSVLDHNWDERLINWIKSYQEEGIEKPLITNYPRNYWYEDGKLMDVPQSGYVSQISFHENLQQFMEKRIPTQKAVPNHPKNIFCNSISAGCVFTVGGFIVPNPDVMFWGEEILMAARAFTNGFDLVVAKEPFMAHLYFRHDGDDMEEKFKRNRRRIIWNDYPEMFAAADLKSKELVKDILINNRIGPLQLGSQRTLEDYGWRCGLDFTTGVVYHKSDPENGLTHIPYC